MQYDTFQKARHAENKEELDSLPMRKLNLLFLPLMKNPLNRKVKNAADRLHDTGTKRMKRLGGTLRRWQV